MKVAARTGPEEEGAGQYCSWKIIQRLYFEKSARALSQNKAWLERFSFKTNRNGKYFISSGDKGGSCYLQDDCIILVFEKEIIKTAD